MRYFAEWQDWSLQQREIRFGGFNDPLVWLTDKEAWFNRGDTVSVLWSCTTWNASLQSKLLGSCRHLHRWYFTQAHTRLGNEICTLFFCRLGLQEMLYSLLRFFFYVHFYLWRFNPNYYQSHYASTTIWAMTSRTNGDRWVLGPSHSYKHTAASSNCPCTNHSFFLSQIICI